MATDAEKLLARCAAYKALLDTTPLSRIEHRPWEREHALYYIKKGMPEHARYHMCGTGIPKEYIVAVDTLIG